MHKLLLKTLSGVFSLIVLTMDKYEFHLQTALKLVLLWRGNLGTVYFDPEFNCAKFGFCNTDHPTHAVDSSSWISQEAASFSHHRLLVSNMIKIFGGGNYQNVSKAFNALYHHMKPSHENKIKIQCILNREDESEVGVRQMYLYKCRHKKSTKAKVHKNMVMTSCFFIGSAQKRFWNIDV